RLLTPLLHGTKLSQL
ncbi:type VI secretion IcmF domain protein, partial [Vibrio parahaemolyticus V-223/04]